MRSVRGDAPAVVALVARSGKGGAPKRYAAPAGAVGSLSGLVLQGGDGLDKPTRVAIVAVLTLIPPIRRRALVERARAPPTRTAAGALRLTASGGPRVASIEAGNVQTKCKHARRHSAPAAARPTAESLAIEPNRRTPRHPTTPRKWAHNPKVAGSNPAPATQRKPWKSRAFVVLGLARWWSFLPRFPPGMDRAYRGIGVCWHHAAMSARWRTRLTPRWLRR